MPEIIIQPCKYLYVNTGRCTFEKLGEKPSLAFERRANPHDLSSKIVLACRVWEPRLPVKSTLHQIPCSAFKEGAPLNINRIRPKS